MIGAELFHEGFSYPQIGQCFALAMMTNINEIESDDHLTMSFYEFLEALARCANNFTLEQLDDYFPQSQPKNMHHLDKKLECICLHLMEVYLPQKQFESLKDAYAAELQKDKELQEKKEAERKAAAAAR